MSCGIHVLREDLLELGHQLLEILSSEVGVALDALGQLALGDGVLEEIGVDAHNHVGEHLDETTIGVPAKAGVVGLLNDALDRLVIEAQVEHGVHHARHGEGGAGAHRYQQGILGIAQLLAHAVLEVLASLVDLGIDALRPGIVIARIGNTGLAGDGESWRHRQANLCHLGQVGALAADHVIH